MNYKALIFDLDGTLIDSTDSVVAQLGTLAQEFGGSRPTQQTIVTAVHESGGSIPLMLEKLIGAAVFKQKAKAIAARHPAVLEQFKHLAKPYLGALEVLGILKERGCKLGIFTSRPQWIIDSDPSCAIILPYFDAVIAMEHAARPKPHPDGLLAALTALNVEPSQALMVGDMVSDIQSAHAAGVPAAALLHGFGGHADLAACNPEFILKDLSALLAIIETHDPQTT